MKKKYILLTAITLFAVVFIFLVNGLIRPTNRSTIEITQQRFDRMLSEQEVQEVVLVDKQNFVEITLSQVTLQQPKYRDELEERNPFYLSSGPHYRLKIADNEIFNRKFYEAQQNLEEYERIGYKIEERSGLNIFGWLVTGGIMLTALAFKLSIPILLIVIVIVLVKRSRRTFHLREDSSSSQKNANGKSPISEKTVTNFPLKLGDRITFVPTEEIACFYAQDNHVYLYNAEGKAHLVEYTLADLETKLPQQFVRVHRSTIINSHLIQEIKKQPGSRFNIKLRDAQQKEIITGQSYASPVKQLFEI